MNGNATLVDAARAYVRAAIEVLAKEYPDGPPRVIAGLSEWVRTSPIGFVLRDREEPYWADGLLRGRLSSIGEYADFLAEFRADPVIAPQIDTLVGTALGASRLSAIGIANYLVRETAAMTGPLRFDDERFSAAFQKVNAEFRKSSFDFVLVAPIWRVKIPSLPVQFSPSLEIAALTDEEIVRCLDAGQFPQPMFGGFVHIDSSIGVRFRFQLRKRVGDAAVSSPEQEDAVATYQRGSEELRKVLHVLRLFKAGRVSIPGHVSFSEDWPVAGGTRWGGGDGAATYAANAYELTPEEVQSLKELWIDVEKTKGKKSLAAAIRRFGYAGEPQRTEDKFVDLMIAAESFFLSDAGDAADRGELSYRMAMRFAYFAAAEGYTRSELFQQMRRAYRARSSIVHGDEPKKSDLKSKDVEVTLEQFVALTEELLRGALKSGITMVANNDPDFGRWEDLILR